MIKKILIGFLFIFAVSCGFQPILKNFDISKVVVKEINITGKNELTYLLSTKLKFDQNSNLGKYILNINILETANIATKNSSGIATEENFTIILTLNVLDSKNNSLINETFSETKKLEVTNSISQDQTTKNIERAKFIETLAQKVKFKIIFLSNETK